MSGGFASAVGAWRHGRRDKYTLASRRRPTDQQYQHHQKIEDLYERIQSLPRTSPSQLRLDPRPLLITPPVKLFRIVLASTESLSDALLLSIGFRPQLCRIRDMDLILGACVGYQPRQIRPFVESLRRWYHGEVVFVTAHLPTNTQQLLRQFQIEEFAIDIDPPLSNIQIVRYSVYREILLRRPVTRRAFIVDVEDVYFQGDPFLMLPENSLVTFLEEETIGNCPFNCAWIEALYGSRRLAEIAFETISCSGTTAGTRSGLLHYTDLMCREITAAGSKPLLQGSDQGVHNHLIYGELTGATRVPNRTGAVQTLQYQKEFRFDQLGRLLNVDGTVCPLLHQIDRYPKFFSVLGISQDLFDNP